TVLRVPLHINFSRRGDAQVPASSQHATRFNQEFVDERCHLHPHGRRPSPIRWIRCHSPPPPPIGGAPRIPMHIAQGVEFEVLQVPAGPPKHPSACIYS